jgi:uracil phosphoribosyltransferase
MQVINLGEQNSIFNQYISEIRNIEVQNDSMRFRRNCERMGEIFAYEISKNLNYSKKEITTPLGTTQINLIDEQPVLATVLRAGLPFLQGFLNYFDKAENAFISAFRKHKEDGSFTIESEYIASPIIDDRVLILADPMLATGLSMEAAYQAMLTKGTPSEIHVVVLIASQQGINFIKNNLPQNTTIWAGAIDKELSDKSYIIPGLGDAGDLAYGVKN